MDLTPPWALLLQLNIIDMVSRSTPLGYAVLGLLVCLSLVAVFLGHYLFQMVGVPACAGFERKVSAGLSQVTRTRRDRGGERAVPASPAGGRLRFRL